MRGYCGLPAAMRALDVMNTPKVPSSGSTSEELQAGSGAVLTAHLLREYVGENDVQCWRCRGRASAADG